MDPNASLTPELATTLRRYQEIQREELRLRDEKATLQDKLAAHMARVGQAYWFPDVDGVTLKVRYQEETLVEYDEPVLRQRLGDRFVPLLAPDPKKIRQALDKVAALLAPMIEQIGSLSPDKVRAAIAAGVVKKEEFQGAFKKTSKRRVAVSRARPEDAAAGPSARRW